MSPWKGIAFSISLTWQDFLLSTPGNGQSARWFVCPFTVFSCATRHARCHFASQMVGWRSGMSGGVSFRDGSQVTCERVRRAQVDLTVKRSRATPNASLDFTRVHTHATRFCQLPTGCERTPYGHIYATLASAGIPLRSCMEMCVLNTLRPWLAAGCSIIRNNIWLFHIQNSYLSSLRECNEQWRVLSACQQFSTTCVRCDILHEAFCTVSLHGLKTRYSPAKAHW